MNLFNLVKPVDSIVQLQYFIIFMKIVKYYEIFESTGLTLMKHDSFDDYVCRCSCQERTYY